MMRGFMDKIARWILSPAGWLALKIVAVLVALGKLAQVVYAWRRGAEAEEGAAEGAEEREDWQGLISAPLVEPGRVEEGLGEVAREREEGLDEVEAHAGEVTSAVDAEWGSNEDPFLS